jgi:pentatricopeptide repeat protein
LSSFDLVIACLANAQNNRSEAAGKAEKLLLDMRDSYKAGDHLLRPNSFCYNSVMDAWGRAGNPKRAEEIFLQMCEDFKNGNEAAKPQTATFNSKLIVTDFPCCSYQAH